MPTTPINGIQLYWELNGDTGDPVVLVHGSWGDHHTWSRVAPPLSRSFRVLSYDRRGHSKSERPAGQGSIRDDVADLAALIEHLDLRPAHIIGTSFGGSIVLRLAAERPDLFRSLIVHEPPLFSLLAEDPDTRPALAASRDRVMAVIELLTAGDFTGGARQFVETIAFGPGAWSNLPQGVRDIFVFNAPTWLDEMRDPEVMALDVAQLRGFAAPTLLTAGDQSPPFFPAVVARIAEALPHAETRTLAKAGHVPQRSHPEEYGRIVTSFLRGAPRDLPAAS